MPDADAGLLGGLEQGIESRALVLGRDSPVSEDARRGGDGTREVLAGNTREVEHLGGEVLERLAHYSETRLQLAHRGANFPKALRHALADVLHALDQSVEVPPCRPGGNPDIVSSFVERLP